MIFILTGCGDDGIELLPVDSGIAGVVTYDGALEITVANQETFQLSGTCNVNGEKVKIVGSLLNEATCSGGEWSIESDLTYLPDGHFVVGAQFSGGEAVFNLVKNIGGGSVPSPSISNPLEFSLEARYDYADEGDLGKDSFGGHDAITFSNITYTSGTEKGTVLNFNGTDSEMRLNDGSFFNKAFDERTVVFSFKASDFMTNQVLYEEGGSTNGLVITIDDGYLIASVRAGGTSSQMNLIHDILGLEDSFVDIAVSFNKGEFKLYVNDEVIERTTTYTSIPTHGNTGGLGRRYSSDSAGGSGASVFNGQLASVHIFERTLNSFEIKKLLD